VTKLAGSLTDHIKAKVAAELDRQRPGLDGLRGVRAVAISVKLPAWPARGSRAVVVQVEIETPGPIEKT